MLRLSKQERRKARIPHLERVRHANRLVYGADKVGKQMNREGIPVASCTVERLMGARQGRPDHRERYPRTVPS